MNKQIGPSNDKKIFSNYQLILALLKLQGIIIDTDVLKNTNLEVTMFFFPSSFEDLKKRAQ